MSSGPARHVSLHRHPRLHRVGGTIAARFDQEILRADAADLSADLDAVIRACADDSTVISDDGTSIVVGGTTIAINNGTASITAGSFPAPARAASAVPSVARYTG